MFISRNSIIWRLFWNLSHAISKSQFRGYSAPKFVKHQVESVLLCTTGLQQHSQTTVRMSSLLEFVIYSSATQLLVRGGVTAARACGRLVELQPAVASTENTPPARLQVSSHFLGSSIIESDWQQATALCSSGKLLISSFRKAFIFFFYLDLAYL